MLLSKNYLEWSPLNFITFSLKRSECNYGAVILSKPKTSSKREPSGITFLEGNQPCSHNRSFPPVSLWDVFRGCSKHIQPRTPSPLDCPNLRHHGTPQIKVPGQSLQTATLLAPPMKKSRILIQGNSAPWGVRAL